MRDTNFALPTNESSSCYNDSESSDLIQLRGWRKFLSIRTIVSLISLWSVAISAATVAVMLSTTYDNALHDVTGNSENVTSSCFSKTEKELTNIAVDLLTFNAVSISDSVLQMLNTAHTATNISVESYFHSSPGANLSSWNHIYSERGMMYNVVSSLQTRGIAVSSITVARASGDKGLMRMLNIFTSLEFGLTLTTIYDGSRDDGMGTVGITIPHDGGMSVVIENSVNLRDSANGHALARFGLLEPGVSMWQRISFRALFAGILLTTLHYDPISDTNLIFEVSLSLPRMSQVLRELAEKTMEETGATIYIYAVDASSPFNKDAIRSGLSAAFPRDNFYQVDTLLAVSNGTSYKTADINTTGKLLNDIEANDPGIREIAIGIHNQYSYHSINKKREATFIRSLGQEFIVQVSSLQPERGLDWWLVSAINADYVLGNTQQQQEEARLEIKRKDKKTDDDLNEKRTIILIVILSVSFALFGLSILIGHKMLQPLGHLKDEMRKVSEMNLETETTKTVFYELNAMQASFQKMVRNLKEYKAYVPTAVLSGSQVYQVPPTGIIGLVFTDIVSSTALWARAATAMIDALELHNMCIRKLIQQHDGYEVKTIGDAFMISFSSNLKAIEFCMNTQEEFVKQSWPSELELPPQYNRPGDNLPIWNGLRLRMGCHIGEAGVEENPLTGRADYRGSTVCMAARLEAKALPGTLCVTRDVYQAMKGSFSGDQMPTAVEFGCHELRGIGSVDLVIMTTSNLTGRLKVRQYNYEGLGAPTHEGDHRTVSGGSSVASTHVSDDGGRISMQVSSRNKKTGLALSSSELTVAVCRLYDLRLSKVFDNYNLMLRLASDAATQTDGVLRGVTDRTLTVVWNGSKSCRLHTTAALRFASQIEWRAGAITRIGIATGTLLHGNIGTSTQRFATTIGLPLEAAQAAADVAHQLGAYAVLADCTEGCKLLSNSAISPFLRMADSWIESESNKEIMIYQVLCSSLMKQLEDGWGIVADGSATAAEAHNKAFKSVLAGDRDQLEKMKLQISMKGDDCVLSVCIQTIYLLHVGTY